MPAAFPTVEELLPHRGRALLLSRVVGWTEQEVCCEASFGHDSQYVRRGLLEPVCGLEVLAQAAGTYLGLSRRLGRRLRQASAMRADPPATGYLVGVPRAELLVDTLPVGRTLTVRVGPLWQEGSAARFQGMLSEGEILLLTAELDIFEPKAPQAKEGA